MSCLKTATLPSRIYVCYAFLNYQLHYLGYNVAIFFSVTRSREKSQYLVFQILILHNICPIMSGFILYFSDLAGDRLWLPAVFALYWWKN